MRRLRDRLTTLALLAAVLCVPAGFASYLFAATTSAGVPALTLDTGLREAARAAPSLEPFMLGVLRTRGAAAVDWNSTRLEVTDGSYAYTGGEVVHTGEQAMAVLDLGAAGRVSLCPGSQVRVTRRQGTLQLEVLAGSARFAFAPGTDFRVAAGGVRLAPAPASGGGGALGEVVAGAGGGCLVCQLRRGLAIAAAGGSPAAARALPAVPAGSLLEAAPAAHALLPAAAGVRGVTLPGAAGGEPWQVSLLPVPATLMAALTGGAEGGAEDAYLCRCAELARHLASPRQAAAPAATPPVAPPAAVPPPLPPGEPPVALAAPGAPGIDESALPPPAAGLPEAAGEPPALVLPPPLVPLAGSGGGGVISPS